MMKSQYRANINVLVSSLVWGLTLSLAIWASRWFITDDGVFYILWRGGNFLALILYPLLVYVILRRKTNLWVNTFFFSTTGSLLASIGVFLFSAFQNNSWADFGISVFGVWLIIRVLLPRFGQVPAVQNEWDSPLWDRLNDLSLKEFLFLRFNSMNDTADYR